MDIFFHFLTGECLIVSVDLLSLYCSNNILYPKEDKERKVLLYACRNCDHKVINSLIIQAPLVY